MAGSAGEFDPYHKWLGIPPRDQPPNHYRLLGLQIFEADEEVIESAASRLIAFCEQHSHGPHAADSRRVVFEIAAARLCLLDPAKRQAYDQQLKATSPVRAPAGVSRNPAARSAGVERRAAAPPPPPRSTMTTSAAPAIAPEAKPRAAAPPIIVADQTPTVNEANPFAINTGGGGAGAARSRKSSGTAKSAHLSSSAELDEMLSGLALPGPPAPPSVPAAPPRKVSAPVSPRVIASKSSVPPADAGELSSLFGEPAPPTTAPPPAPSVEPAGAELADIFGALSADSSAPATTKRARGGRAKPTPATQDTADSKNEKKPGKKKNSQALLLVGGMAAVAVLLMVAGAFLLFGGDAKPKPVAKKSTGIQKEQEPEQEDENKSPSEPSAATETASEKTATKPSKPAEKSPPASELAKAETATEDEVEEEPSSPPPASAKKAATDALLELCMRGGSDLQIKKLLASGADLEAVDLSRRTPLRLAVMGKHALLVKALIAAKADVNALDSRGETALMSAVQNGDEKLVATLLDAKADPNLATIGKNGKGTGTTPLHIAARQGHTEIALLLIEHAARLDVQNKEGVTPLMVAAWQGHSETALALLARGADVKTTVDAEGQTPLMYAAHGGKLEIVEAMLGKGAVASQKSASGATALSFALGSAEPNAAVANKLRRVAGDEAPALDF